MSKSRKIALPRVIGVRFLLLALLTAFGGACTPEVLPVEPVVLPPAMTRPSLSLTSHVAADGSEVTVVDASGITYTFSFPAREIRRSDGAVLELDAEQTAAAAEAFYAIAEMDVLTNHFSPMLPPPYDCNNGAPCEPPPGECNDFGCVEPTSFGGPTLELVRTEEMKRRGRMGISYTLRGAPPLQHPGRSTNGGSIMSSSVCSDILDAIIPPLDSHVSDRTVLVSDAFGATFGAAWGYAVRHPLVGAAAGAFVNRAHTMDYTPRSGTTTTASRALPRTG
jgi:hypothetical protein